MRSFRTLSLSLLVSLLASSALAGPANPKHIPADAKWFLHVDMEALRGTTLFAAVKAEADNRFPLDDWLDRVKQVIGFNPLTDIDGITVYSSTFDEGVGAALIYANIDTGNLLAALQANPQYARENHGDHVVHSWADKGKNPAGAFAAKGLIIVANEAATVKAALDVLDGKKPGGPALAAAKPGLILQGGATQLNELRDRPGSRMLANADSVQVAVGEKDGALQASMDLKVKAPEVANQVRTVADGIKALVVLDPKQPPALVKLVQMIDVTADGLQVKASLNDDSKDFLILLRDLAEQMKNRQSPASPAGTKQPEDL